MRKKTLSARNFSQRTRLSGRSSERGGSVLMSSQYKEDNMKRHQENTNELLLDDIYESKNPAVKSYALQVMAEEMDKAHERATIRVAQRFRHLLSPQMQQALAAQYPVTALAASA